MFLPDFIDTLTFLQLIQKENEFHCCIALVLDFYFHAKYDCISIEKALING